MQTLLRAVLIPALLFVLVSACGKEAPLALNINDLSADPAAFSGTLVVTGVVAAFAPQDPTLFGVMDKKELQCLTPNCKKFLLPVRMQGTLPKMGDEILLTGSFVKDPGGFTFVAQTVKFVRNHPLGGSQ